MRGVGLVAVVVVVVAAGVVVARAAAVVVVDEVNRPQRAAAVRAVRRTPVAVAVAEAVLRRVATADALGHVRAARPSAERWSLTSHHEQGPQSRPFF